MPTPTMPAGSVRRKPKKAITGSDTLTHRFPNRVIRKLKPAARKAGLSKNGLVVKAVEQFIDAALSPAA